MHILIILINQNQLCFINYKSTYMWPYVYQISIIFIFYISTQELWKTKIDAAHNYWGYNITLAVGARIRDRADDPALVEVQYLPMHNNNQTVLDGKCPPGWGAVLDTCYSYIGAPMSFADAKAFCMVSWWIFYKNKLF